MVAPQKIGYNVIYMYVYLIFKSTKDVILKIESTYKSFMLDSQESSMDFPNSYMDMRGSTR